MLNPVLTLPTSAKGTYPLIVLSAVNLYMEQA